MKKIFYMLVSALTLTVCTARAQNATQSVVYLKDGSKLSGDLLEMRNDTVTLKTADGNLLKYPMTMVERISNTSSLGKSQTKAAQAEMVRYKIKRVGRDLRIGRSSLDLGQTKILFGDEVYKKYYSAFVLVGTGAAFITAGVLAAGLGAVWHFKGANDIMQRNGRVLLMAAGASFATGVIMNTVGKVRIGRIVRRYNSGMFSANDVELSPCIIGFDDMVAQQANCTIGASLNISF